MAEEQNLGKADLTARAGVAERARKRISGTGRKRSSPNGVTRLCSGTDRHHPFKFWSPARLGLQLVPQSAAARSRLATAVVTAVRSGTVTMRKPYVATTPPKRNSSPGSVRLKPTAFRVCAPRAFSNTVARVRRVTPDRGADIVGLSVQRRQRLPSWHATDWPHLVLCLAFFAKIRQAG